MEIFYLLEQYYPALLKGLTVTLKLSFIASATGIVLGVLLGVIVSNSNKFIQILAKAIYISIIACPVLIILYWFHFPFQKILNIVIDPFITAALTMTIINTIGVANTVQNAILKFPNHYTLTAHLCGMRGRYFVQKIQLPIIFNKVYPSILLLQVNVVHMSLFASMISVPELFRVAQRINAVEHQSVLIYTLMAIFFILVLAPLMLIANKAHKHFRYDENEL